MPAIPMWWWMGLVVLPLWWWLMMVVHELGHFLGCLISGATVEAVILWPWSISETVRSGSHAPLADTWAGPVLGAVLPVLLWWSCSRPWPRLSRWIGGWAGFCLVANGIYLGMGWIDGVGDAGDLLRLGTPVWQLVTFGIVACGAGLWIWHVLLRDLRQQRA